jgi:lipid A ethanolaminephosphotransferase
MRQISNIKKTLSRPISLFAFSCIVSIGTLLLYNIPFFNFVANNTNENVGGKIFLLASLVVIMLVLNFMMTYLVMFLLRIVGRILLAILSIINATAVYFIYTYSVMIDATTIENVFNTRYSEASGFFSWWLWLFIVVFGVLPALFCLLQPVVFGKAKKLGICCGCSLVIVLAVAAMNFSQTLFISEHDTELGGLLQPWSYLVNTCRVISFQQDEQAEEIKLPDGQIADDGKAVVVLVIGESARKANFQLYGYQRDTNPLLSKQEELKVYQATACATYTTAGTKAILEPENSDDLYELLPNYAFRTGVDVSWRTSNWGEPPIHIDEYINNNDLGATYPDEDEDYDEILLKGLRERIESSQKNKVLIVLHTSTSHGPNYASKYPKEFEVYKPVAKNVEEGQQNVGLLINAYDNTIRYTDFLLNSLINTLRAMEDWNSAMIFISDHGESLGENKMFMHGLPMKLAPKVQYEIPFLVWTSKDFRDYKNVSGGQDAPEGELPAVLEQHYIFHSVLNLLSIQSPAYNKDFDIFKSPESLGKTSY